MHQVLSLQRFVHREINAGVRKDAQEIGDVAAEKHTESFAAKKSEHEHHFEIRLPISPLSQYSAKYVSFVPFDSPGPPKK